MAVRPSLAILVAACGTHAAHDQADAPSDTSALVDTLNTGVFSVTSSVVTEGGTYAAANTCDGANTSPDLTWVNAPAATQSYAVVLSDKTIPLVHWVIFDIPASLHALPPAVMKVYSPNDVPGAHQTASYQASVIGYLGPCPPVMQGTHTYEMVVHALDVAALPGTSPTTTRQQALAAITPHNLAAVTLTATYTR